MFTRYRIVPLVMLIIALPVAGCTKEEDDFEPAVLAALTPGGSMEAPCTICSCSITNTCLDYQGWTTSAARADCTGRSGTFGTTACSTDLSLGTCAGTVSSLSVNVQYYVNGTSIGSSNRITATSACTADFSGSFTSSTVDPQVRVVNNSSNTQSYGLNNLASACDTTPDISLGSSVTAGSTTAFASLTQGTYYFVAWEGAGPAVCTGVPADPVHEYSNGSRWTISVPSVAGTKTWAAGP